MKPFAGIKSQHQVMRQDPTPQGLMSMHIKQINTDLKRLGADLYDMWVPETLSLPSVIHLDERLVGVVYGRYKQQGRYGQESTTLSIGRGMLIVTDKRILLLDKKPLFMRCDEIPSDIISGVTYARVAFAGTVALHTRAGDFSIRTFNHKCAKNFVKAIEAICFIPEESET